MDNKYISNQKGICPCCNKNVAYWDQETDEDLVCYHWKCSCGKRGIEYYKKGLFIGHCVHNEDSDDLDDVNKFIKLFIDFS